MPAKGTQKTPRRAKASKEVKAPRATAPLVKTAQGGSDLAAEVKRLARELDAVKLELSKRPVAGGESAISRRDQDKVVADRLARLDEKVDSVWNRLADLEERLEGEGAGHGHDTDDFDEAPEKDYYER
jgi:hypothetical protein